MTITKFILVVAMLAAAPLRADPGADTEGAEAGSMRPGGSDGWWRDSTPQRRGEESEYACIKAEPTGALAIARHLAATRQIRAALRCLDVASEYHPEDSRLPAARQAIERDAQKHPPTPEFKADDAAPGGALDARDAAVGAGGGEEAEADGEHAKKGGPGKPAHGKAGKHAGSEGEAAGTAEAGEHEGKEGEEHEGKEGEEEEAPPHRVAATYLHAKKDADTLTDIQLQATRNWEHAAADGTLHLLRAASDVDHKADTLLDARLTKDLPQAKVSLLLGYSANKGEVSYKEMAGARYVRLLPAEAQVGVTARYLRYDGGSAMAYALTGQMHATHAVVIAGQIDLATGAFPGSAFTGKIGYEVPGLELVAFLARGHGIPSHAYLRPEDDEGFTTYGAELEMALTKSLGLVAGVERRHQDSGTETEVSAGLGWKW